MSQQRWGYVQRPGHRWMSSFGLFEPFHCWGTQLPAIVGVFFCQHEDSRVRFAKNWNCPHILAGGYKEALLSIPGPQLEKRSHDDCWDRIFHSSANCWKQKILVPSFPKSFVKPPGFILQCWGKTDPTGNRWVLPLESCIWTLTADKRCVVSR